MPIVRVKRYISINIDIEINTVLDIDNNLDKYNINKERYKYTSSGFLKCVAALF